MPSLGTFLPHCQLVVEALSTQYHVQYRLDQYIPNIHTAPTPIPFNTAEVTWSFTPRQIVVISGRHFQKQCPQSMLYATMRLIHFFKTHHCGMFTHPYGSSVFVLEVKHPRNIACLSKSIQSLQSFHFCFWRLVQFFIVISDCCSSISFSLFFVTSKGLFRDYTCPYM